MKRLKILYKNNESLVNIKLNNENKIEMFNSEESISTGVKKSLTCYINTMIRKRKV